MRIAKTISITKGEQRDSRRLEFGPGASVRSKGIRSVSYKTPTCTRPGSYQALISVRFIYPGTSLTIAKPSPVRALDTKRPASSDRPV